LTEVHDHAILVLGGIRAESTQMVPFSLDGAGAPMIVAAVLLRSLIIAMLAAEPDPKLKAAQAEAQAISDATLKGDFEKLADHTHPKVIEVMGGRRKMIERTRQKIEEVKRDRVTLVCAKAMWCRRSRSR
jgi:hypothetical protein